VKVCAAGVPRLCDGVWTDTAMMHASDIPHGWAAEFLFLLREILFFESR
jgi:hypothetical protein